MDAMNSVQKQTRTKAICPPADPIVSCREGASTEMTSLARHLRAISTAPHPDVELPDEESLEKKTCRKLN